MYRSTKMYRSIKGKRKPSAIARSAAPPTRSAAIITSHNYGRYLALCLDSVFSQTLPYGHVVVVDDGSTDDTADVIASFISRGFPLMHIRGNWHDYSQARRAGVAALPRTRFLTFVDADNTLAPDFHEKLIGVMSDHRVGVAYPEVHSMDERGVPTGEILARPFDPALLRDGNYVDACALVRTEAYEQAGGWGGTTSLTDWDLWLRITRMGWTMQLVPGTRLHYRRHSRNMSLIRHGHGKDRQQHLEVMRSSMQVCLLTLFCGRQWALDQYAASLKALTWDKRSLFLVAVDNSRSPTFAASLQSTLADTGIPFIIVRDETSVLQDIAASEFSDSAQLRTKHVYALSAHLARLYARARTFVPAGADFVFSIEDDIEVPPDCVDHFLWTLLQHKEAAVVSGAVACRFVPGRLLTWAGTWSDYEKTLRPIEMFNLPEQPTDVMTGGMMCTLFRRRVFDSIAFRPTPWWHEEAHPYYDWAVGKEINRLGWKWMLDPAVRCGHWQRDESCLMPEATRVQITRADSPPSRRPRRSGRPQRVPAATTTGTGRGA